MNQRNVILNMYLCYAFAEWIEEYGGKGKKNEQPTVTVGISSSGSPRSAGSIHPPSPAISVAHRSSRKSLGKKHSDASTRIKTLHINFVKRKESVKRLIKQQRCIDLNPTLVALKLMLRG